VSSGTVLWLDNDRAYLQPYVDELIDQDFIVVAVETALEAEQQLQSTSFDFVIIDVMVPTRSDEEESLFSPTETNCGYRTGAVFWHRNRDRFVQGRMGVLVLTLRLDEQIRDELAKDGLPRGNFATKYELSDPALLVQRLRNLKRLEVSVV
jgi:hypothetical protein